MQEALASWFLQQQVRTVLREQLSMRRWINASMLTQQ
jgi:hypothetical protein